MEAGWVTEGEASGGDEEGGGGGWVLVRVLEVFGVVGGSNDLTKTVYPGVRKRRYMKKID